MTMAPRASYVCQHGGLMQCHTSVRQRFICNFRVSSVFVMDEVVDATERGPVFVVS